MASLVSPSRRKNLTPQSRSAYGTPGPEASSASTAANEAAGRSGQRTGARAGGGLVACLPVAAGGLGLPCAERCITGGASLLGMAARSLGGGAAGRRLGGAGETATRPPTAAGMGGPGCTRVSFLCQPVPYMSDVRSNGKFAEHAPDAAANASRIVAASAAICCNSAAFIVCWPSRAQCPPSVSTK